MDEEKIKNEESLVWEEAKKEFEKEKKDLESKKAELLKNTPENEQGNIEDELKKIDIRLEEIDSNLEEIDRTVNEQEWDEANNKYVNKKEQIEEQEEVTENQEEEHTEEQEEEELIEEKTNKQDIDENSIDGYYYELEDDENSIDDYYYELEDNDENIIDVDYVEIEESRNEKMHERAARLAKEYAYAQGQNVKISAKMMAHNAKEGIKEKIDDAKTAVKMGILNSPPVRFVRGVKRIAGKIFKGFKTAGKIAIGVGALTAEAVSNAKDTIQRASAQNITNLVNSGRDKANSVLDKLENKVLDVQTEVLLKQYKMMEQEQSAGR